MKGLLSILSSIAVAVVLVYLVMFAFKITFAILNFIGSIMLIGLMAVIAIPVYIIVRKKLFN